MKCLVSLCTIDEFLAVSGVLRFSAHIVARLKDQSESKIVSKSATGRNSSRHFLSEGISYGVTDTGATWRDFFIKHFNSSIFSRNY